MSDVSDFVDKRQFNNGNIEDGYLVGDDLLALAREIRGNKMLMSFSRGKDSIATWLWLKERDVELVPYTLYIVPGLGYQERALQYYEQFFGTKIYRLPHPHFYYLLQNGKYMPPNQCGVMNNLNMIIARDYDLAFIDDVVAIDAGLLEPLPWCAMGMRRADNLPRMRLIDQTGVLGDFNDNEDGKRRHYYPIWDWKIDDVCDIIVKYNVKLPVDYELFGWRGTTETISYRRLAKVRDYYPEDWAKILEWFPLLDSQMFRYERI